MQTTAEQIRTQSTERTIRTAAILYLLLVVTSIFGFFVPQSLVVSNDAAATAHRILTSETLFRVAVAAGLVASILFVFLVWQLYRLLNGISASLAALMVILALLSIPISFVGALTEVAVLRLLHPGAALSGLGTGELHALTMFFLGLSGDMSSLNSIFFGLWLVPFGLLVIKSSFIPKIVGYLVIVAGIAYLVGSLNFLLSPPFASAVSSVATLGYLGELAAVVWLVVRAVRPLTGPAADQRPASG